MPSERNHKENIWKRKKIICFLVASNYTPLLKKKGGWGGKPKPKSKTNNQNWFYFLKKKYVSRTEAGEPLIFRKGSIAFLRSYAICMLSYLFPQY